MVLSLVAVPSIVSRAESISSSPSPAVTNKALEIKIQSDTDLGNTVYCYTWCKSINGTEKSPWAWGAVNTSKFQMTGSGGTYAFKIADIQTFYGLTDSELAGLTELGFIAKNAAGGKTGDLSIQVIQGRTDAYSGGEGTEENPFILKTTEDLLELASTSMDWAEDVYLRLDSDIDGSSLKTPIGSKGAPFRGHFDGGGHTIYNIDLSNSAFGEATGLFGGLKNGEIKNLGVLNAKVSGMTYTGVLVGYATSGSIRCCYTSGTVSASSICAGGLVGDNAGAVISDCYSGAQVTSSSDNAVGGLVGKNAGVIQRTYATGIVKGLDYVGGIVGANYGNVRQSVAINSALESSFDYNAKFGGNSNSRNVVQDNYSWSAIPLTGSQNSFGYHATQKESYVLGQYDFFKSLAGWDFEEVWEWKNENNKSYPALRKLSGQTNLLPEAFMQTTGVIDVLSPELMISVGPNPVSTILYIRSTEAIASCRVVSLSGALIADVASNGAAELEIDMAAVAPGLYVISVITADGHKSVSKIIKN